MASNNNLNESLLSENNLNDSSEGKNSVAIDLQQDLNKAKEFLHEAQEVLSQAQEVSSKAQGATSAIKPESNLQRNLDRENGGLEKENNAKNDNNINDRIESAADASLAEDSDIWDERGEQVEEMIEAGQDLNNASTSSRDQSFLHRKKQKGNDKQKNEEEREADKAEISFVDRVAARKELNSIDQGRGGEGGGHSF